LKRGQLVEVTLVNDNVAGGITLHWHGLDVPNAMDGVAGVTQDAVMPGRSFTYRFVADQVGTYWYHSHQLSHQQVRRGLLGAIVVDTAPEPGQTVRVRVVNTDNALTAVWVTRAPYQVVAVDGTDLHHPPPSPTAP
jgi:FtsP/CotA-like multicopper oxidase with cupredoxin domain